ncbi:alpha/beta fold hydrolase [Hoeflea sp. BAL378]|uniref:alpha/beta fold hydrolase n=1 Tax=Hoeflea sp. BAL378 TaxID=1547437 RepID=UPI00068B9E92|nr:alpha/beta fold hydrolase [Hoeflea sp. BAL378]
MRNPLIESRDAFAARHPEQRIDLNGREWGLVDVGSGPALLLIPGTLGRGDIFWQQIEALKDRVRILAVTYPGTGGVADWSGDLVTLLDRLGVERAVVLGSSLGGYLAQYLAANAPARAVKLIGANTLCSVQGIDQRMPYALDLMNAPITELRAGFGMGLSAWAAAHPDQADLVALLMAEVNGRIPEAELRNRLNATKSAPDLPPVTLPRGDIFTIEADDDPLIPPEMRAAVRERLNPGCAYRFLSGGHFPYVARPADYIGLLEQVMDLNLTGTDWGTGDERAL